MRDSSRLHLTFVAFCLLSVIRKRLVNNVTTPSTNQHFCPDSRQMLRHQYGISAAELQTFLRAKRPPAAKSEEKRMFSQASFGDHFLNSHTLCSLVSFEGLLNGFVFFCS